jgi:hypothetical protein
MYFTATTEDQTAASAAITAVGTFWTAMKAYISNQISYATHSQVDQLDNAGHPVGAFGTTPATGTGAQSGNMTPPAVQALAQWRTGHYVNYREIRGRTYIPGMVSVNINANGQLATTFSTAFQSACNTLIGQTGAHLAVWSKRWADPYQVISGQPWEQFAVLRSRRD